MPAAISNAPSGGAGSKRYREAPGERRKLGAKRASTSGAHLAVTLPRTNPDGSVSLRSAASGPVVTVAGPGQIPTALELLTQQSWAIAPLTGDDSADGTPAAPLRTGAEFTRRTYGKGLVAGTTSLDILEPFPVNDDYILIDSPQTVGSAFLHVRGATPTPLDTGTITVRTNAVTNTSLTTIQASIDLAPHVGSRIRIDRKST